MIYTDGQHVVADTEEELHEWIQRVLGFKREWYHDKYLKGPRKGQPNDHPHYDVLTASKQAKLMKWANNEHSFTKGSRHMMKNCANVKFVNKREIPELSRKMVRNTLVNTIADSGLNYLNQNKVETPLSILVNSFTKQQTTK